MVLYDALITPSFSPPLASLVSAPLLSAHLSCWRTSCPPPSASRPPSRPVSTRFLLPLSLSLSERGESGKSGESGERGAPRERCRQRTLADVVPRTLADVIPLTLADVVHAIRAPPIPRPVPCPRDSRTSTRYMRDHAICARPRDSCDHARPRNLLATT